MSSRARRSLGGGALRDISGNSRRMSLGGASLSSIKTPSKRANLEEWGDRRNSSRMNDRDGQENRDSASKRARLEASPSSTKPQAFVLEGTTALERYRMRKQMKAQQQQQPLSQLDNNPSLPPLRPTETTNTPVVDSMLMGTPSRNTKRSSGLILSEDHDDETMSFSSGIASTPLSTRRRLGSGARRRSVLPPRQPQPPRESENTFEPSQQTLSQLTQDSDDNGSFGGSTIETIAGNSVEAGLRSRLREADQLIQKLEKDKMALLVQKAPLENRLMEKEEELEKETNRLHDIIDSLEKSNRVKDDRYRDLEATLESAEEELRRYRLEAKKPSAASSRTLTSGSESNNRWDRIYQNDRENAELKDSLRAAQDEIKSMKLSIVSTEKELHGKKIELKTLWREFDQLQMEYNEVTTTQSNTKDAEIQLERLTEEHTATAAQLNAVLQELAGTKARTESEAKSREEEHKAIVEDLKFQLSVAETRAAQGIRHSGSGNEDSENDVAVLHARIDEQGRRILELEKDLLKAEEIRRQMHNKIQELRGNIRVFVRTRPFLPGDGAGVESAIEVAPDEESLVIQDQRTTKSHDFNFDKVFPPSSGQDQVFKEVADFVQSALDGYNVCLFSYGQTGSGKTHTMQGSGNGAMRGIIPRAVEQILTHARFLKAQKWNFQLSVSFLEIYNENLRDLLNKKGNQKLAIKRSKEGKSFVDGLSEAPIETNEPDVGMEQLAEIMATAASARSVASTKMNAQSSRSHSVFMLHLRGTNLETGAEVHGALNLCDLAGSERLDRSQVTSDAKRLKESQNINKSLSALGNVFNALAQGASHVPFRDSKLTYLLQDCLSGDGKALMFVNLSPTVESSNESLCSLRFAQRVNQVELGKPTKHIQYNRS